MESDELLARSLQTTFDEEYATPTSSSLANKLKPAESLPLSDDYWEIADPNPDIHALFQEFNKQYFWGKLSGIEVRWSPRMTLCAGLCCYEGRGGLCSVRLSVPLLKLRPRKDLVDTLLHEMIHAYLFVTQNFRDHDGHGPEFHKHMYRINREAGTHITVYHTFHNEVSLYKQHWWKCNGPCKNRPPYFGLVKRSMNRKPGPYDPWWKHHEQACGGSYVKIKEPEGYKSKSKHKKESQKNGNNSENSTVGLPFKGKGRSLGLIEPFKKNELNSNTSHFKKSAPNESNPLSAFLAKASGSTSSSGLISPFTKNGIIAGKNIKDKTKGQNITKSSQKSVLNGSDKSSTCAAKTKSFLSPEKTINQLRIDYFLKREVTKVENISDIKTASIQKHANSKNIVKEKTAKRKLKDEAENLPEKKYKVKSEFTKSGDLPSTSRENLKNPIVDLTISYVKCPACDVSINENKINQHLDECLM